MLKVGLKKIERWNTDLESQVQRYEGQKDPQGKIVFYGPSNFTRWSANYGVTPLEEDILGASGARCAINRGFGSSCPEHHLYYYSRMVRPLAPKVLVYAPGLGNGTGFGYTPEEMFFLAERVVQYALSDFPDMRVYLCGLPFRYKSETALAYNGWLKQLCDEIPNCTFVDCAGCAALQEPGLHGPDGVHYNAEGYARYAAFFRDVLKEELAKF